MKRFFSTTLSRRVAEPIGRAYKKFTIAWLDKTHRHDKEDQLMEQYLDNNEEEVEKDGVVRIMARYE